MEVFWALFLTDWQMVFMFFEMYLKINTDAIACRNSKYNSVNLSLFSALSLY
jgi:hypothetical protein